MISVRRLSNKEAKLMITAAEQMSDQIGLPMCIAVTDESGNVVRSTQHVEQGTSIAVALDDGQLRARVEEKSERN